MTSIDFSQLQARFPAGAVGFRIQRAGKNAKGVWAVCVPYVTNRSIQRRLDEVCGPANWRNEFRPGPAGGVLCGLSIRDADGGWITKWDGAENTAVDGVKGGLSAAMKRSAVQWGIGRYLYDLDVVLHARISERGRFRGRAKVQGGPDVDFRWDPPELPAELLPTAPAPARPDLRAIPAGDDELARLIAFIREAEPEIPSFATIHHGGNTHALRRFLRQQRTSIHESLPLAREVAAAVERETGRRRAA